MNITFKSTYSGIGFLLLVLLTAFAPAAVAGERIPQLGEDTAKTKNIAAPQAGTLAAPLTRVCEPGAKWIRLGFKELTLGSYDSLSLTSSDGDRYTFEGNHWKNLSFHTRALRGECVSITPHFGHPDSRYQVDGFQFGTQPLALTTVVAAGAGDICDSTPDDCRQTSDLIVSINPTTVFTAGDSAYGSGTLTEFKNLYDPSWGRFKELTRPVPGNHDYLTHEADGYFDYFNGSGKQTGPAGDRSKGYYSYDVGDWHFVALNTSDGSAVSSTQLSWLTADLAANTKPCTVAYFHHPLISRGHYEGYPTVKPIYDRLYAAKADLVLVGHDHSYQRYGQMDGSMKAKSDGLLQVLVGTGGRNFYPLSGTHVLLEAKQDHTWGVLKLTLTATGYTGKFVPVAGETWTDDFTGDCHKASPGNTNPVANFTSSSINGLTATFTDSSTDSDGTIASRSWAFGDGTTSTATNPSKTYTAAGTYNVTLTVTDNAGGTNSKTSPVKVGGGGGNTNPVANFTSSVNGLTATFTDSSTDSEGTISSRSWAFGDNTTSTETNPSKTYSAAGTYNVTLTVTDNAGGTNSKTSPVKVGDGDGTQTYKRTKDVLIPDTGEAVTSKVTVSGRTGNAGSAVPVKISIVHPFIDDLIIDLVAPDGSVYNLHNQTGGSANNINKTVTLDLSREALNGTWRLRARDDAPDDTGKIDGWSITF